MSLHADDSHTDADVDNDVQKLAAALQKLENIVDVLSAAVDELLEELHYLLSKPSVCNAKNVIHEILNRYDLQLDWSVTEKLTSAVCLIQFLMQLVKDIHFEHNLIARLTTNSISKLLNRFWIFDD